MPLRLLGTFLLIACASITSASQPSPADLARLNRSLNPTPTPNIYGIETHISGGGLDIDAQGNHLFSTTTPAGTPKDDTDHRVAARVKPVPAFRPLWTQLRDFEAQIGSYEKSAVISRARGNAARERLALLRINYGLARKPDGSALTPGQMRSMSSELARMKKSLLR